MTTLAQEAQAADQQHSYSSQAPAWKQASDALQAAAAECASVSSQAGATRDDEGKQVEQQEAGDEGKGVGGNHIQSGQGGAGLQGLGQQWEAQVESLVKNVLVWAQNIQRGASHETGMGSTTVIVMYD